VHFNNTYRISNKQCKCRNTDYWADDTLVGTTDYWAGDTLVGTTDYWADDTLAGTNGPTADVSTQ
jgi:hypothetical protein